MAKRPTAIERLIHRIDEKIAALQYARAQILEDQSAAKATPKSTKRTRDNRAHDGTAATSPT